MHGPIDIDSACSSLSLLIINTTLAMQMKDVQCFFISSGAGLWLHSKTCTEFEIPDPAHDDGVRAEAADPAMVMSGCFMMFFMNIMN